MCFICITRRIRGSRNLETEHLQEVSDRGTAGMLICIKVGCVINYVIIAVNHPIK